MRAPRWCAGMAVSSVPGARTVGGRRVIDRRWPAGESVVDVTLPLRLAYRLDTDLAASQFVVFEAGPAGPASLFLGPYLLARAAADNEAAGTPPSISLAGAKVDTGKLTVTSADGTVVLMPAGSFAPKGEGFRVRVGIRP
jgi:hypothetical protein